MLTWPSSRHRNGLQEEIKLGLQHLQITGFRLVGRTSNHGGGADGKQNFVFCGAAAGSEDGGDDGKVSSGALSEMMAVWLGRS